MMTTPRPSTTPLCLAPPSSSPRRACAVIRWPFTHPYAAPLWLALRLYVGWIWWEMGLSKLQGGWLTSDPIGVLLTLVADGTLPVPFECYRGVADTLIKAGLTPLLSHALPFLELAVGLAFIGGVLTPVTAVGAILLNLTFILSGVGGIAFDGPVIVAEILFILAFRVVDRIGVGRLALRRLKAAVARVRPARPEAAPARR